MRNGKLTCIMPPQKDAVARYSCLENVPRNGVICVPHGFVFGYAS